MEPHPPQPDIKLFRCNHLACRVTTFTGSIWFPLNMCPLCLTQGLIINEKKEVPNG